MRVGVHKRPDGLGRDAGVPEGGNHPERDLRLALADAPKRDLPHEFAAPGLGSVHGPEILAAPLGHGALDHLLGRARRQRMRNRDRVSGDALVERKLLDLLRVRRLQQPQVESLRLDDRLHVDHVAQHCVSPLLPGNRAASPKKRKGPAAADPLSGFLHPCGTAYSAGASTGSTEMNVRPLSPLRNLTAPICVANIV